MLARYTIGHAVLAGNAKDRKPDNQDSGKAVFRDLHLTLVDLSNESSGKEGVIKDTASQ